VTSGSTQFPQWGLSWTYDRYGNRTAQSVTAGSGPSNSLTISATTNRITDTGFVYDENGNLTAEPSPVSASYTYDAENRQVAATVGSSSGAYVYDGSALRVKKCVPNCTSPTTTTIYIFSGAKVVAEYENGAAVGSPTREYIYLGSQLLAKMEGGATTYYHPDHLSARVMTNASGSITAQSGHYPFGENWYETAANKLKFTSYERDSESGNDYAIFRMHINRFGRFASPDPIPGTLGIPQSLNRFSYVMNDPIGLSDPLGLSPLIECHLHPDGEFVCHLTVYGEIPRERFEVRLPIDPWDSFLARLLSLLENKNERFPNLTGGDLEKAEKALKELKDLTKRKECEEALKSFGIPSLSAIIEGLSLTGNNANVFDGRTSSLVTTFKNQTGTMAKIAQNNKGFGAFFVNVVGPSGNSGVIFLSYYFFTVTPDSPVLQRAFILAHEAVHLGGFTDQFFGGSRKLTQALVEGCFPVLAGKGMLGTLVP
jgi:RHS repeat-associated protein